MSNSNSVLEIKAKNYEDAMAMAMEQTGKSLDELKFECIKEPWFFFKGTYRVTIEEDTFKKNKKEKKNTNSSNNFHKKNNDSNQNNNNQKNNTPKTNNQFKNVEQSDNNTNKKRPNNENKNIKQSNNFEKKNNNHNEKSKTVETVKTTTETTEKPKNTDIVKEEKVEEKIAVTPTTTDEPVIEIKEDVTIVAESTEEETNLTKNNQVSPGELDHFIRNFVEEFAKKQGVETEVETQTRDGNKYYILTGEDASKLIGYHGENLNAMQIITSAVVNEKYSTPVRVLLDIGQYKTKREENLRLLARRTARKVITTRKSQKLEPMTANERRIVHSELQSNQKVTTESHGVEPHRFVVIKLK